ncbi:MAG: GAF domain-containing sensor histidine kinase, partial [Anaerolineae bacterium]|nr:GAF domain-containing sensor histidine kinase [Anaerolineae bacterium]
MLSLAPSDLLFYTATLVITSVTILIALVVLLLLLWQDSRSDLNLTFALFLGMVVLWASGNLLSRFAALGGAAPDLVATGVRLLEIGFTGSCVGIYLFTLILTGGRGQQFTQLAAASIALVVIYQAVLALTSSAPAYYIRDDGTLAYSFSPFGALLYATFALVTMLMAWQRPGKIKGRWLRVGILVFCLGILIDLISPELRNRAVGMNIGALATLLTGYAMLRIQIIDPLAGRATQLQAVRDVGLAITSRLNLQEVLSAIAAQAAGVLNADGAAIFLNQGDWLALAAVHNMPTTFIGQRLAWGEGLAGKAAAARQSTRVDDYRRDWNGAPDMPFAHDSFGSVVAAPLMFAGEVMGVLEVIQGVHGRRFDRDDVRLLELLGPQAAVAITNSRLFERQRGLMSELEVAVAHLRELDEQKTQMIQMTSHQLKNPLQAAMVSLELLEDESDGRFTEQMHKDAGDVWTALQRMERIVHNILNLESLQSGKLAYDECSVEQIVVAVAHDYREQAVRGGVDLSVSIPEPLAGITGNQHYLTQALANLVENAVKFTPTGGKVVVSAENAPESVLIRVEDTGIGIPDTMLSRVFERFFRARQPGTDHVSGSGLGLSLVKAVIDA